MESSKILNYCRQIIIAFPDLEKKSGLFLNSGFCCQLCKKSAAIYRIRNRQIKITSQILKTMDHLNLLFMIYRRFLSSGF